MPVEGEAEAQSGCTTTCQFSTARILKQVSHFLMPMLHVGKVVPPVEYWNRTSVTRVLEVVTIFLNLEVFP